MITAQKRNGHPKQKHQKVKNEEIWPVAFVCSQVKKIKIIFWLKLEVVHATRTKNTDDTDMQKCFSSIIFYTFQSHEVT